jgi:glycosyltransferase involved in cell wall biosynthesis
MSCVLTIAIPTYNRVESLVATLESLLALGLGETVEVVVLDNASSDETSEALSQYGSRITVIRQLYNLGIEGNIIAALRCGSGRYVWAVSDHMVFLEKGVRRLLEALPKDDFGVGYAGIMDYGPLALPIDKPFSAVDVEARRIGEMLFCVSNLSGVIVSRSQIKATVRQVYRFSGVTYPNLGAYTRIYEDAPCRYFPDCTRFQTAGETSTISRKGYDTLIARFYDFTIAVRLIVPKLWQAQAVAGATSKQHFLSALRLELEQCLDLPATSGFRAALQVFKVNAGPARVIVGLYLVARCVGLIAGRAVSSLLFIRPSHFLLRGVNRLNARWRS